MDVKKRIDINCDLGEGMPNDAELMPLISSCNIACGGHFGTKETMRSAIQLAKLHKVKVGAHPSYPDRENFGRKSMNISSDELASSLRKQLSDFISVCHEEQVEPNHIKLHGALYNDSAKDISLAHLVVEVMGQLQLSLPIYAPLNSMLAGVASEPIIEAFIDRRYNENGSLVSRSEKNALIEDPTQAWDQLKQLYLTDSVTALNDKVIQLAAETYCIHGDAKNALEIARFIYLKLEAFNIALDKNG
ncbi:MAG: 5-oxoprolinase subunit PxpA [Crocinitomicaceae bacterium]|nr:5-oxoprolinase subunit PxpA [Crocinitomicaceae bacterium]